MSGSGVVRVGVEDGGGCNSGSARLLIDAESNNIGGNCGDLNTRDCNGLSGCLGHRELQVGCRCGSAGGRCGNIFGSVGSWGGVVSIGINSMGMATVIRGSGIVRLVMGRVSGVSCGRAMSLGGIVLAIPIRNWLRVVIVRLVVGVVRISTGFQSKDGSSCGCGFREHFKSIDL